MRHVSPCQRVSLIACLCVVTAEYLRKRNTDGSDSEDEIIKAKSKKSKKPIIKEVKPDNVEEAPKPADPSLDELLKKCENQEPSKWNNHFPQLNPMPFDD